MKRVLLIGARSSLGTAMRKELSVYEVIGTSRRGPFSERLRQLDLSSKGSVDEFLTSLQDEGAFDAVIFTAANKLQFNRFEKISLDSFHQDFLVNTLHPAYLLQRLLPKLSEGASIIFTLTEMVIETPPFFSPYVVSKFALLGLMKALDAELGQKGFRVNAVSPGMMETQFIQQLPSFLKESYRQRAKRLVTVEEVAEAVRSLIEDSSRKGENVVVIP